MCFTSEDCDWTADISEESEGIVADVPVKCNECHGIIEVGQPFWSIYQQEHESCPYCRGDFNDDETEPVACTCGDDFYKGETFEATWCGKCQKLRQAIVAAELEEGCGPHESEPPAGSMMHTLSDFPPDERHRYGRKALQMFPELKDYLVEESMLPEEEEPCISA